MESIFKGQIAQLKVEGRAAEHRCVVGIPTTDARYDLVIDKDGKLHRIQIKYADAERENRPGRVRININGKPYTAQEIDALLVYIPKIEEVCWLPPEVWAGKRSITLRYSGRETRVANCVWDYIW